MLGGDGSQNGHCRLSTPPSCYILLLLGVHIEARRRQRTCPFSSPCLLRIQSIVIYTTHPFDGKCSMRIATPASSYLGETPSIYGKSGSLIPGDVHRMSPDNHGPYRRQPQNLPQPIMQVVREVVYCFSNVPRVTYDCDGDDAERPRMTAVDQNNSGGGSGTRRGRTGAVSQLTLLVSNCESAGFCD